MIDLDTKLELIFRSHARIKDCEEKVERLHRTLLDAEVERAQAYEDRAKLMHDLDACSTT